MAKHLKHGRVFWMTCTTFSLLVFHVQSVPLHYFLPGHTTVFSAPANSAVYLKDFKSVVDVVGGQLAFKDVSDEGIYSPIVTTSSTTLHHVIPAEHSHVIPVESRRFAAAYLCSFEEGEVLPEVLPREYYPGVTAVVPCAVIGRPEPLVWWQVMVDGKFGNITLETDRMFLSPNNHLIIKNATITDSATYRCVGWNECGNRCPSDPSCTTNLITEGDPVTITISPTITNLRNRAYSLNNKLDPFIKVDTSSKSCFIGTDRTQCVYVKQHSKRHSKPTADVDAVFVGDTNYSKIEGGHSVMIQNAFGICMFECQGNYSSIEDVSATDIKSLDCDENAHRPGGDISASCMSIVNGEFISIVYNSIQYVPDVKLARMEEEMTLTVNTSHIQFYTSKVEVAHGDIQHVTCYHNNKEIVPDTHTTVTKINDRKNNRLVWSINKDCPMRYDIGDYYCTVVDTAGEVSLSKHTSVLGVWKEPCREVKLLEKTFDTLAVTWSAVPHTNTDNQIHVDVTPFPCQPADGVCGTETRSFPLNSTETVTMVTNLTAGCCYSLSIFFNNGSVIAENRYESEFKTSEIPPKAQTTLSMRYTAFYFLNDKLRISWRVPDRETWGSDTITYVITRNDETYRIPNRNYHVIVSQIFEEGRPLNFGKMKICNPAGCSVEHEVVVTVPFRPNKPRVEFLSLNCREVKLNLSNKDSVTYKKYTYSVMRFSEDNNTRPEILFTGNLSLGVNTVRYLDEGQKYHLKVWGVNSNLSNTPLVTVPFETKVFCTTEIAVVAIIAFIVLIVGVMVVIHIVSKKLREKADSSKYTYSINPPGDVFSDTLGDDISIIHMINQDQEAAPVKQSPSSAFHKLKLTIGLKRSK